MNKDFKQVLNEVNRINDLMRFNENREIINESLASALKSLRTLIKNGLDDIAKYGIKEIDNIARSMVSAKTADEFFELLDSVKLHDSDIAKQLRRDVFDILPEATQNRLIRIVRDIENNLDRIPEDQIENFLDEVILEQFPNEPESVRVFMKDSITDSSGNISNKMSGAKATSSIDDLINKLSKEGNSVEDKIDKIQGLTNPEREMMKRTWRTFWLKKENFYDVVRRRASYGGKESARLKNATNAEIEKIMSTANNPSKTVQDETAIAALEKSLSSNIFTAIPKWARIILISGLLTKGASFSLGMSLVDIIAWGVSEGGKLLGYEGEKTKITQAGGINKLEIDNETKILKALNELDPSLFNSSGTLKDGIMITYSEDEKSLVLIGDDGSVKGTYTLDQINSKLID